MRTERRAAALALLLIGLAALAVSVLLIIPWVVQAQAREVTPTTGATGTNPPAQPTNLQASAEHDSVTLTWQASTDQTVTHYAILRRHPDTDASQVFHVIESNAGPETGYTDGSVSASSTYIYRVKAVSPTGVSQWSGYVKADTPAAPDTTLEPTSTPTPTPDPTPAPEDLRPTGLTVSLVENRVTLSWAAPKEDADSVTGYEILRRRPTEGESTLATLVADTESTATTYTDATANEASVRYVYRVKALRGSEASLWSNFDRIDLPSDYVPDPPPTSEPESTPDDQAPTGLTAALAQGGGVALSWTAPAEVADSVTGYEVLRAAGEGELSTLAADTGNTATAYTDTTATEAGETYAYQVKAIRGEERSQASGQARVQLPQDAVDLAPSNLTAEAVDSGVNLSWTAPAEDADSVTGYEVLRAVGEGELATLAADTGSTTTSYTDATATEAGETYAYQVKAIRGEDRSQSSNRVALIPVEPPATPETLAPSNLTFEIREHGVTLAWDAPAAAADSVTGYRVVRRRPNQGENEWLVWKWDTGSTETTYRDGHAQTHGEYYIFRVRALRGDDYSKMSNFVQVTRPEAAPETTEWAPSNLQGQIYVEVALGEEESTTQVKLSWDAPAEGTEWVRGYEVQRAACDGDFTALAADTGSTATGYTDADVEAGESYTYRVRARRPQGKSLWTNWWTVLIPGGSGEGACGIAAGATGTPATPEEGENYALSAQVQVNAYLTPATLLNTLLGYDEAEGTGTLAPNELTFDEGATFRVTSVNTWPGFPGLVLMLTADSSAQDAALADRDFILEADETVLVVGTTEFSFDDALGTHSETTGDNGEYTGVVIVTWTEGESGLVAGETVDFRLVLRDRPEEAQFTQHDTEVTLVKNTGQTADGTAVKLVSPANPKTPEVVHRRRVAQQFTTGTSAAGYVLGSIGIDFDTIANSSTAGAALKVTLNEEGLLVESGIPGRVLCTLSDPATFTGSGLHTFDAPETCPKLEPGRNYLVVVRRDNFAGGTISLKVTTSAGEDTGSAALSSISDRRTWLLTRRALYNSEIFIDVGWRQVDSESHLIEVRASTVVIDEEALLNKHFNTLNAAGNDYPLGIWSDGTTMWVADLLDSKIYAYNMATKARDADKDFNTLAAAGNNEPRGLWSDGSTMWVSDYYDEKLYAYNLQTKVRVPSEDFNNLFRSNQQVGPLAEPFGIWSDGNTMWVADHGDHKIYAYDMVHKGRKASRDFDTLDALPGRLTTPGGIWADETTMFVTNRLAGGRKDRILAYWRYTTSPQPGRFITVAAQNNIVSGIWSDGNTMWVSDEGDAKIYAYRLPDPQERPAGDLVSLEHVTDTTAMVKVDIEQLVLVYGTVEPTVSVKILGTYSSATMYVHPEGGYARFLLMGLRPETQYTLEVSYGISNPHKPNAGRKIFRTDYARLDGIETSGLTHTEATVTVSLPGAGLDRGCCFKFYPHSNKDEAKPEHTYYLRHKPSDDTVWSDSVELTFSDFTADVRLTGLDPGTAYDVEVGEDPTFMPPRATLASYVGTLTVADEGSESGLFGMDLSGFFSDPYGSMSPDPTFTVGGTEHSLIVLYRHPYGGPDFDQPALYLEFDSGFAADRRVEFTLTIGTTVYNSADASREGFGGLGWEWLLGPNWSEDDMVAVQIDFTAPAEAFREGTRLEELGAFTTPTMPPALAFEAEMTVGVSTIFDGYDEISSPSKGVISSNTFDVGGVQYIVANVGFEKGTNNRFALHVAPALPFDSFTLTLGSTDLLSSSASVTVDTDGNGLYTWSGTDPNWTDGQMVDVKLEVPLINICGRSPALAYAIKAATPSYDFCHVTSQLDLAGITELDLSGVVLGGLQPQLPPGTFDGLYSLTHLDISDTNLLSLSTGIFEGLGNLIELDLSRTLLHRNGVPVGAFDGLDSLEILRIANSSSLRTSRGGGPDLLDKDIFRGLGNLRELDVRPSKQLQGAPLSFVPLTSLETYNGQSYTRPVDAPKNLTATMEDFPGDSSRKKVTLTWEAPDGVSGITGYQIRRTHRGQPNDDLYAHPIARVGSNTFTYVHGANGGIGPESPNGFNFTYYVAAITADGEGFPVKVFVSP